MGKMESGPDLGKLHDAGTALLFVSGALYFWFQTAISYHTAKVGLHSKCVFIFRLVVSCMVTCTGITYPFFNWFSYTKFTGSSVEFWSADDGGFMLHVLNCAEEWIACLCLALYPASFYKEFQTFSVEICYVANKEATSSRESEYVQIQSNDD